MDRDGSFCFETFANSSEGAAGIEDVVEKQDMHAFHFREMAV